MGRHQPEEVKSGVRLALTAVGLVVGLVLGISTLLLGFRLIETDKRGQALWGTVMVLFIAVVLWATVAYWAKWFFGVCCLFTLRSTIAGLLGRTVSVPSMVAPRIVFAEFVGVFAAMSMLSYRFVEKKPNWLDAICLVGASLAVAHSLIDKGPIRWMLLAVLSLGVSAAYNYMHTRGAAA